MRLRAALSLATVFVVCFTVASWAAPVPDRLVLMSWAPDPTTHPSRARSCGLVTRLSPLKSPRVKERNTMEFLVGDDTKVEGKLQVRSQPTVEYRSADGKNIAVHVVVKSASAFRTQ